AGEVEGGSSVDRDGAQAAEQRGETHQGRAVGWSGRSSSASRRSPASGVPGGGDCSATQPVPRTSTVQPSACARVSASRNESPRKLGVPGSGTGPSTGGTAASSTCGAGAGGGFLSTAGTTLPRPALPGCRRPPGVVAGRTVGWTCISAIVAAPVFRDPGAATTPP